METKLCCICGVKKPATDEHFATVKELVKHKDGYARSARMESRCRPCLREAKKRYSDAHTARVQQKRATMKTKICTRCENEKPIDQFYVTHCKATGKRPAYTYTRTMCKVCTKIESDSGYARRKGQPKRSRVVIALPTREEMAAWWAAGCPLNGFEQAS